MTSEIENPVWDVFTDPPVEDNSIIKNNLIEIHEDENSFTDQSRALFKFQTKDTKNYLLPGESFLEVRFRIMDYSQTPAVAYKAAENVAPVNNGFNLIKDCKFYMETTELEHKHNDVGLGTTILNLVEYADDHARSIASNEFFYPDTGAGSFLYERYQGPSAIQTMNRSDAVDGTGNVSSDVAFKVVNDNTTANLVTAVKASNTATAIAAGSFIQVLSNAITDNSDTYNEGHRKRRQLTLNSRVNTIFLPLKRLIGFLKYNNKAFIGKKFFLELTKNTVHTQMILASTALSAQIDITYMSWWVPHLKPSLVVQSRLLKEMNEGASATYMWKDWEVHRFSPQAQTVTDLEWTVSTTNRKPICAYVFFQLATAASNITINGMLFHHVNLRKLSITMNETRFPYDELKTQFDETSTSVNWARAYTMFLEGGMKLGNVDIGSIVSYEDFRRLYPIFRIDLSKTEDSIFDSQSVANVKVSITRDNVAIGDWIPYCLIEYERKAIIKGIGDTVDVKI